MKGFLFLEIQQDENGALRLMSQGQIVQVLGAERVMLRIDSGTPYMKIVHVAALENFALFPNGAQMVAFLNAAFPPAPAQDTQTQIEMPVEKPEEVVAKTPAQE